MTARVINAAGRALIERDEGCVLHTYADPRGILTIGFGHTGLDVTPGEVVTYAMAEALLEKDLTKFSTLVNGQLGGASTTSNQFSAMCSLAYNIGDGAFGRSTVLRRHLAGDFVGAARAFAMWDEISGQVSAGLLRRRGEEAALYATPDAPPAPPNETGEGDESH